MLGTEMSRRTWIVVTTAAACVVVDVYLLGVPVTLFFLLVATVVRGMQALVSLARGRRSEAAFRGKRALTFAAAAVLILGGIFGNTRLAAARGTLVARALKEHRAQTGAYPRSLQELVPRFLPEIPPSCVRLTMTRFMYRYKPEERPHPRLTWTSAPPRGTGEYLFDTDKVVLLQDD
jgi:hypothetical protein